MYIRGSEFQQRYFVIRSLRSAGAAAELLDLQRHRQLGQPFFKTAAPVAVLGTVQAVTVAPPTEILDTLHAYAAAEGFVVKRHRAVENLPHPVRLLRHHRVAAG